MAIPSGLLGAPMTDTTIDPPEKKQMSLLTRFILGFLASGITTWTLTFCSLHGIDFTVWFVNSEAMKAAIVAFLTGVAGTPECIPKSIAIFIIFCRMSGRTIKNALTRPLPDDKD